MLRGKQTAKAAKQQAKNRSSGSRYTRRFQSEEGEEVLARPRGVTTVPPHLAYTPDDLAGFDNDGLLAVCEALQCVWHSEMDEDAMVETITKRYDQLEPAMNARHYCDRNKSRKGVSTFENCQDSETAVLGDIRKDGTECIACNARLNGDKGMGFPSTTYYWTVYDYRASHQVKKGDENEYVPCTREEDEEYDGETSCRICNKNFGLDERDEADIMSDRQDGEESEAMKELQARGYARRFVHGNRKLQLSGKFADALFACEARLNKRCKSVHVDEDGVQHACGGKLKKVGAHCTNPECEEEYDYRGLKASGWNPDEPSEIECPHCGETVTPAFIYECRKCDDPQPASLMDADILICRTGSKQQTNWSFTEQEIRPLNLDDDEHILRERLPDYEVELAAPSDDVMDKFVGSTSPSKAAPTKRGGGFTKKKGKPSLGGKGGKRKGGFSKRA